MPGNIIHLSLTPAEGYMIAVMLRAAMEQYENGSLEERNDPDIRKAYEMWVNIAKYLPSEV